MTEPKNVLSVDTLRQRAMALLGRREYSLAELRQKLRPFASDGKRLEAVLADLVARDWQSDARFAESWVRSHAPRQRFSGADREGSGGALRSGLL